MITISYEQIESLLKTLEIIEDREFSDRLTKSIQQDTEGQSID